MAWKVGANNKKPHGGYTVHVDAKYKKAGANPLGVVGAAGQGKGKEPTPGTTIGPSESIQLDAIVTNKIDTTGYAKGTYRFTAEYKSVDGKTVLQTKYVDFEIK